MERACVHTTSAPAVYGWDLRWFAEATHPREPEHGHLDIRIDSLITSHEVLPMRHLILTSILGSVLFATAAQAHAHLEKSMPADGSTLGNAPSELMLHFSEAARLT